MRSTSGSIMYFRGFPICWRSNRQTVRAYSTAEAEYIAASDTIVLSEQNDFTEFFKPLPTVMVEKQNGLSPSLDDAILWIDNQSAITTAKSTDNKPKSRHYALRYLRVRDAASQIMFCPTYLMKADGLTKLECSVPQRRLLLHHIDNPDPKSFSCDASDDEDDLDTFIEGNHKKGKAKVGYTYSIYFGF
ncbi:unnamed protein product [Amoebophrya sp. A120]|nr:unnamed protein product [Amoebophrya sp. A120]|eukprot:GSA120T00005018001.1